MQQVDNYTYIIPATYNPTTSSIYLRNFFPLLFGSYEKVRIFAMSYNQNKRGGASAVHGFMLRPFLYRNVILRYSGFVPP